MKRQLMVTAMAVLSLGVTLATATPAFAGTDIGWTKTTDGAPGGKAKFSNNGDVVTVCDVESDGWAATADLFRLVHGEWISVAVDSVTDGGNDGVCKMKSVNRTPEGTHVFIQVCLMKYGWEKKYCRNSVMGIA